MIYFPIDSYRAEELVEIECFEEKVIAADIYPLEMIKVFTNNLKACFAHLIAR